MLGSAIGSRRRLLFAAAVHRAVGYFDSAGTSQNWILGNAGLGAFATFASDPYMSGSPNLRNLRPKLQPRNLIARGVDR
jgi:hypothetical protein